MGQLESYRETITRFYKSQNTLSRNGGTLSKIRKNVQVLREKYEFTNQYNSFWRHIEIRELKCKPSNRQSHIIKNHTVSTLILIK